MGSILFSTIFLSCVSAVIAALILLDIPLTAKVLLAAVFGFMWFLIVGLGEISEQLRKIYLYARLTFISTEMNRRTPGNEELAWDRLKYDIEIDKEREDLYKRAMPWMHGFTLTISWIFIVGILTGGTLVFYILFQIFK